MSTMRARVLASLLAAAALAGCGRPAGAPVSPTPAPEPTPVPSAIRFEEVTEEAGVAFVHVNGAAGKKWMPETMGAGVATFDADGDGRLDLFFVNGRYWKGDPRGSRQPACAFYRNVTAPGGPPRFVDATRESGLGISLYGMGVAVGDVTDDGAPDVVLTGLYDLRLLVNDGKGRFRDATNGSGLVAKGWATSAAIADLDGDGKRDLFVAQYVDWTPATDIHCSLDGARKSYCTPERYPGTTSRLFLGLGAGRFREVTREAGLENPLGKALGVAVRDVDGDGRLDLAVANDTAPNDLFRNVETVNGVPRFTDVAVETGIAVGEDGRARGAMGISFGDTKGEGGVSLAIGNFSNEMWSFWSAGPRGDFFADESVVSGLGRATLLPLTFGVEFADLDLDGLLDLVGVNGHVEDSVESVQPLVTHRQPPLLFRGLGGGRFADVTAQAGPSFAAPLLGRGLAVGDLDGDGLPDLVVTENGGKAHLYRNVTGGGERRHAVLHLVDAHGAEALGARVTCTVGSSSRVDEVSGGNGYLSVSERCVRIGLGAAPSARVEVRWPGGDEQELAALGPGRWVLSPRAAPRPRDR